MLEHPPASLSGKPKREKRSMRKLEKLTPEKRKMVEDNYKVIRRDLLRYIGNTQSGIFRYNGNTSVNEALSYVVDAALEFDEEITSSGDFANFAVRRCILRYMDEYRKMHRHVRVGSAKRLKIKKVRREMLKKDNDTTEEAVKAALKLEGIDIDHEQEKMREKILYHETLNNSFNDNNLEDIDVIDQINGISRRAEQYFVELDDPEMEATNKSSRVRKKLINEFLIPLALGQPKKKLSQIALEVQLSVGRLSQMMKDDKMKAFIKTIYPDEDSQNNPVISSGLKNELYNVDMIFKKQIKT